MASKNSQSTTQQQVVSQSTSVSVQNVIEAPKPTQVEQVKMLADVINTLDTAGGAGQTGGARIVLASTPQTSGGFKISANNAILVGSIILGALLLLKKA